MIGCRDIKDLFSTNLDARQDSPALVASGIHRYGARVKIIFARPRKGISLRKTTGCSVFRILKKRQLMKKSSIGVEWQLSFLEKQSFKVSEAIKES